MCIFSGGLLVPMAIFIEVQIVILLSFFSYQIVVFLANCYLFNKMDSRIFTLVA